MCGLAKIQSRAGALPRDCQVTDISDGGVRLYADGVEVPERFILQFNSPGAKPRECRVTWRLGLEIGAAFVDEAQRNFAQRVVNTRRARG